LWRFTILLLMVIAICLIPEPANANAGVPMIFVTLPWMLVALIPVILLEGLIMARRHTLSYLRAGKIMGLANAVSTIFGVPLTWGILLGVQILTGGGSSHGMDGTLDRFLAVTWQAPWLVPYESELYWMIPAAFLFLSVPFFLASWFIETFIARKMAADIPLPALRRSVLNANLVSYCLIDAAVIIAAIMFHQAG